MHWCDEFWMIKKLNGRESLLGLGISPRLTLHVPQLLRLPGRDSARCQIIVTSRVVQEDVLTFVTTYHKQHRHHGLE
jgi:hypothetical protein